MPARLLLLCLLLRSSWLTDGGGRPPGRRRRSAVSPGRTGSRGRAGRCGCWRSEPVVSPRAPRASAMPGKAIVSARSRQLLTRWGSDALPGAWATGYARTMSLAVRAGKAMDKVYLRIRHAKAFEVTSGEAGSFDFSAGTQVRAHSDLPAQREGGAHPHLVWPWSGRQRLYAHLCRREQGQTSAEQPTPALGA